MYGRRYHVPRDRDRGHALNRNQRSIRPHSKTIVTRLVRTAPGETEGERPRADHPRSPVARPGPTRWPVPARTTPRIVTNTAAVFPRPCQLPRLGHRLQFQLLAVPTRQFGAGDVGALQERRQCAFRVIGGAHGLVWQQELAHLRAPERRVREPARLRVHVGVERRIIDRTTAGPEPSGPVRFIFRNPVDVAAWGRGGQLPIVPGGGEVERAPEPMDRAG